MGLRRIVWIAVAAAVISSGGAEAGHNSENCSGAHSSPAHGKRFLRAVRCLQKVERRKHGLRSLRASRTLETAAMVHAHDMVRRRYFGHISPEGTDPFKRASVAGYRGARRTNVGENLVSWTAPLTPAQVVAKWMASPPHRRNILRCEWRDVGVALLRASTSGSRGVTVVVEFGHRY